MALSETPGVPVGGGSPSAPPVAQGTNVLAILGLVAAILGLVLSWVPGVGLIIAAAGLVLSIVGRKKAVEGSGGQGVATGGLIVSIIALLASLVVSACAVACGVAAHKAQSDMKEQGFDMEKIVEDAKRETDKERNAIPPPLPSEPAPSDEQK